jgi:excisionase family DNA binding protein
MPAYVYNMAMYSVKEAAQKLGLDTSQVRRLLAKGEIKGKKLARDWVVLSLDYKRKRKPKTKKGGKQHETN